MVSLLQNQCHPPFFFFFIGHDPNWTDNHQQITEEENTSVYNMSQLVSFPRLFVSWTLLSAQTRCGWCTTNIWVLSIQLLLRNGAFCIFICQMKWATKARFKQRLTWEDLGLQTDLQQLLKFNLTVVCVSVIWCEYAGKHVLLCISGLCAWSHCFFFFFVFNGLYDVMGG